MTAPESYAVIGGEGFLGTAIIRILRERYPKAAIASLDVVQRQPVTGHTFESVDITSLDILVSALKRCGATCVFHTASPHIGAPNEVHQKVNVEGTKTVIAACQQTGVRKLVYTSSAGVTFDGSDNINIDERFEHFDKYPDVYMVTKSAAEKLVLAANGQQGLLTCAIRPASIFGPHDRQAIPGIMKAYKEGKTGVIVGSNDNLVDWTYVDNIVHGHLLAAERLEAVANPDVFARRCDGVGATLQIRPVPSSVLRPDGRWLPFETPVEHGEPDPPLPASRNRLDQFASMADPAAAETSAADYVVAGQAFYISNGEPIFFWDFVRALYAEYAGFDNTAKVWSLPASLAVVFGAISEGIAWLKGDKNPNFTVNRVYFMRASRYHNIDRARLLLGYEPIVGVAEGIKRGIQWYKMDEAQASR